MSILGIKRVPVKGNVNVRSKSEANFSTAVFILGLGGVGVSGTPLGVTQKSFKLFAF